MICIQAFLIHFSRNMKPKACSGLLYKDPANATTPLVVCVGRQIALLVFRLQQPQLSLTLGP